jgi:hypothetical protein
MCSALAALPVGAHGFAYLRFVAGAGFIASAGLAAAAGGFGACAEFVPSAGLASAEGVLPNPLRSLVSRRALAAMTCMSLRVAWPRTTDSPI